MSSKDYLRLSFGIEVEVLLKPKSDALRRLVKNYPFNTQIDSQRIGEKMSEDRAVAVATNRNAIRMFLRSLLKAEGLNTATSASTYAGWLVTDEPSLDELPGYWRCEIVSRVLETDDAENWQEEVASVFEVIRRNFSIYLTSGCSMHVHVGVGNGKVYSIEQLKAIMKGIYYYDKGPITTIMPASRKKNDFAVTNLDSKQAPTGWQSLYNEVQEGSWAPLLDHIDAPKMPGILLRGWSQDRLLAWNFSNVLDSCGTIEFRRPPGVDNAADAIKWTSFALGFIANAIKQDWNQIRASKRYPNTDSLRSAIRTGLSHLHPQSRGELGSLRDVNEPPHIPSDEERRRIEKKKKRLLLERGPFVEMVIRSRENSPASSLDLERNSRRPGSREVSRSRERTQPQSRDESRSRERARSRSREVSRSRANDVGQPRSRDAGYTGHHEHSRSRSRDGNPAHPQGYTHPRSRDADYTSSREQSRSRSREPSQTHARKSSTLGK